jgi:REP element-mobilizing transposase RayT
MSKYTKRPVLNEEVCVHMMSRVVQKRFLIDEDGMGEMRRILRTQAAFAGLEVITFCFLKNHFHILVHLDPEKARGAVTDEELVRRFRALYGSKRSPSLGVDAEELEAVFERQGERAETVRRKMLARMGDVSVFMKELKTRFTFWYNETYHTVGTFWAERFRSVLVEPGSLALKAVAAYIDLNAVRAGLAETPQSYRFCGLGEAAGGQTRAQGAYAWLVRGRRGRSPGVAAERAAYADYVDHVNRIVERLHKERAACRQSEEKREDADGAGWIEESAPAYGYTGSGGAVGTASWVNRLCAPDGPFGFLRSAKAKALSTAAGSAIYAVKRPSQSSEAAKERMT